MEWDGLFLRGMLLNEGKVPYWDSHPYDIPAVRQVAKINFRQRVTILAGENGSGKSTIIEAVADLAGMNVAGGSKGMKIDNQEERAHLAWYSKLVRGPTREMDGFFLRAESYFNISTDLLKYEEVRPGFLQDSYGGNPHEKSHGEAFLALVTNRFRGDSLFILDEPESALSPTRQLSLLMEMERLIGENCQFVLATHSPILMAFPGARLYWLDDTGIEERDYKETPHYAVMKRMVEDPEGYLFQMGIGGQGDLGV